MDKYSIANEEEKYYTQEPINGSDMDALVVTSIRENGSLIPAKVVIDELEVARLMASADAELSKAMVMVIKSPFDYDNATAMVKNVKATGKVIAEFFQPVKNEANKILTNIRDREKAVCLPLEAAEKTIKAKMMDYQYEQQRKAQETARQAAEAKRKEADEMLARAVEAEDRGDNLTAQIMQDAAVRAESKEPDSIATVNVPKGNGVQIKKLWRAKIVNDALVPINFAGMCLRPVDMTALNKLASTSKGTMKIDGIEFYTEDSMAIR